MVIGDDDPLGSSVFRTTGFNSIRTTAASKNVAPFIFFCSSYSQCGPAK